MLIRCGVGIFMDIAGLPIVDLTLTLLFAITNCFFKDSFSSSNAVICSFIFLYCASSCLARPKRSFCWAIFALKPPISSFALFN